MCVKNLFQATSMGPVWLKTPILSYFWIINLVRRNYCSTTTYTPSLKRWYCQMFAVEQQTDLPILVVFCSCFKVFANKTPSGKGFAHACGSTDQSLRRPQVKFICWQEVVILATPTTLNSWQNFVLFSTNCIFVSIAPLHSRQAVRKAQLLWL